MISRTGKEARWERFARLTCDGGEYRYRLGYGADPHRLDPRTVLAGPGMEAAMLDPATGFSAADPRTDTAGTVEGSFGSANTARRAA